ncbi:MAG: DNA primase [Candidatus Omnitrophica bacterium]|nr:DNA primase [Candidatus Omnitrophota bacterium]
MAIPEDVIDQIQDRADIVEVISRYIPLKKTGRSYKALCPFHHEKTPSFVVSPDKKIFHCFGCGAGGNVFSFVIRHENLEFPEVIEMLAKKTGVILPRNITRQKEDVSSFASQLYKINELACQFFQTCLAGDDTARDYLNSRGIGDETIKFFKIGYAPNAWEALLSFFKKRGVQEAVLEKAGLAIANDRGGYYDRFRHRVIFPIIDLKERIVGFGGRVLDASLPKYINSPETYIYSKGRNLYGLNFSKEDIKKRGYVLVVEGYLDFIIPYQAGIANLIATLGTALTIDQVKLLKRFTNTVIMVYDPDEAGEAASLRNLDIFISEDVNVYVAELPSGYDPDSYIRKFGAEEFTRVIKSSKNLFDYKLDKTASRFDIKSAHGKARIAAEMLPTIARISNAVLKSNLVKRLAEALSVDEEAIRTELKKVKPDYEARHYIIEPQEGKKDFRSAEKMVLSLMLEEGRFVKMVGENLSIDEFKDSAVRDIAKVIIELYKERKEIRPAKLINHLENKEEAAILISEVAGLAETFQDKEKAVTDCIARIKKDNIRDELDRLQVAIKAAHNSKDENKVKRLLVEYDSLVRNSKV